MSAPSFDAVNALRFDLNRGTVSAAGRHGRLLLVPEEALASLIAAAPPGAAEAFGTALGRAIGERVAPRVANQEEASVEEFVAQIAGEAALAGIGTLSVERWGRAMVVLVERSSLVMPVLMRVIAGVLEVACGRSVWCAALSHDPSSARILVSSEGAVAKANALLTAGTSWAEVLLQLHGGRT